MRYCKSTSFQANHNMKRDRYTWRNVVCDTAKVRVFKQITTLNPVFSPARLLFAILQKYEFSSKSQLVSYFVTTSVGCLRYCKSTSFQANHNLWTSSCPRMVVVCDTAKVRVFKQITTANVLLALMLLLFAILQKYEFSSKSQPCSNSSTFALSCLRYCKSTSFQANHNCAYRPPRCRPVVCDTAKVRVFKQITTTISATFSEERCLRYCKSTSFQANHNTR